eukprot:TRINITY_DN7295_c0_g1_i1.p1 TRINITY_DN7295_c0_g1~~TRINITY_DN7295_c0_g1_i1.p1  ORF type:complete len:876 (+),score=109.30 TRINITY_DN7295_c0_g1_i1:338-2629(+)
MAPVSSINIEGTSLPRVAREVLYLQAYASRRTFKKITTRTATFDKMDTLDCEHMVPAGQLRLEVERLAKMFHLCSGGCVRRPWNEGCEREDVWEHVQEFEQAERLWRQWGAEYRQVEATVKERQVEMSLNRIEEVIQYWGHFVRAILYEAVKLNTEDVELFLKSTQQGFETMRVAEMRRKVQKFNFVLTKAEEKSQSSRRVEQHLHQIMSAKDVFEDRIKRITGSLSVMRASVLATRLSRSIGVKTGFALEDLIGKVTNSSSNYACRDLAKQLQVLLDRGLRTGTKASLLEAGKETLTALLSRVYAKRKRNLKTMRNLSQDDVDVTPAEASTIEKRLRRRLATVDAWEAMRDGMITPVDLANTVDSLNSSLNKASLGFDAFIDPHVLGAAEERWSIYDSLHTTCEREQEKVRSMHGWVYDALRDTRYPQNAQDSIVTFNSWLLRVDSLSKEVGAETKMASSMVAARAGVNAAAVSTASLKGDISKHASEGHSNSIVQTSSGNMMSTTSSPGSRTGRGGDSIGVERSIPLTNSQEPTDIAASCPPLVLQLVSEGLRTSVGNGLNVMLADIRVAIDVLGQPPSHYFLDEQEIAEGRPLCILIPLHRALMVVNSATSADSHILFKLLTECRSLLLEIDSEKTSGFKRKKTGYASNSAHANYGSLKTTTIMEPPCLTGIRRHSQSEVSDRQSSDSLVSNSSLGRHKLKKGEEMVTWDVCKERLAVLRRPLHEVKVLFNSLKPFSFANLRRLVLAAERHLGRIVSKKL